MTGCPVAQYCSEPTLHARLALENSLITQTLACPWLDAPPSQCMSPCFIASQSTNPTCQQRGLEGQGTVFSSKYLWLLGRQSLDISSHIADTSCSLTAPNHSSDKHRSFQNSKKISPTMKPPKASEEALGCGLSLALPDPQTLELFLAKQCPLMQFLCALPPLHWARWPPASVSTRQNRTSRVRLNRKLA